MEAFIAILITATALLNVNFDYTDIDNSHRHDAVLAMDFAINTDSEVSRRRFSNDIFGDRVVKGITAALEVEYCIGAHNVETAVRLFGGEVDY